MSLPLNLNSFITRLVLTFLYLTWKMLKPIQLLFCCDLLVLSIGLTFLKLTFTFCTVYNISRYPNNGTCKRKHVSVYWENENFYCENKGKEVFFFLGIFCLYFIGQPKKWQERGRRRGGTTRSKGHGSESNPVRLQWWL